MNEFGDDLTVDLLRTAVEEENQGQLVDGRDAPQISIVIPTYNPQRIHSLLALLESVRAQDSEQIETIVVADADPGALADLQRKVFGERFSNVSIIINTCGIGASVARNVGVAAARGAVLAFVDDDAELTLGWAQAVMRAYNQHPKIAGVVGSVEPLWESREDRWLPRELYWIIGCTGWLSGIGAETLATGPGTGISFHREVLSEEAFSPMLGQRGIGDEWRERGALAEDTELCVRVQVATGRPLLLDPQIRVLHRVPRYKLSIRWIAYRSYQVGRSRAMLRRLYPRWVHHLRSHEEGLVRRLAFSTLPQIVRISLRDPRSAWLKLRALTIAVAFVLMGYVAYSIRPAAGATRRLEIHGSRD